MGATPAIPIRTESSSTGSSTGSTTFGRLLAPLQVGGITLRNRMVMGSMHTGLEDRLWHHAKLAAYFEERARGGVAMMITGGFAMNLRAWLLPFSGMMTNWIHVLSHRRITRAARQHGAHILLQLLHSGRYGYHPLQVSASTVPSPITPFKPKALTTAQIRSTVRDYARSARLAQKAGYSGVEIMGSEGYLLNQFICPRTNQRTDEYGGSLENRMRFPLEIVRAVREACGPDFVICYRMSLIDLVPDGNTWDEIVAIAQALEKAGIDLLNTGIGWHEARVPTIATAVPRAAFRSLTGRIKSALRIPVMASNRINTPEVAEDILAQGQADLISMARPLLADPDFARKVAEGKPEAINTCIACNQGCLDLTFSNQRATCLVNPRAGYETEIVYKPVAPGAQKKVAVVGGGMAGLTAATVAADRGHEVTLFESASDIGGQFNLAAAVPGKEEFQETIRYYRHELARTGVTVKLNTPAGSDTLQGFDHVVVASGVKPRVPSVPGFGGAGQARHPKVVLYSELLSGAKTAGQRVAVIGSGGIGVDTCSYLLEEHHQPTAEWAAHWGVDLQVSDRGGLAPAQPRPQRRQVVMLQRNPNGKKMGAGPGKTTGWAHKILLKQLGVRMIAGAEYVAVDDAGLHIRAEGKDQCLDVDTVVLCAGQESVDELKSVAQALGLAESAVQVVGGAKLAGELDARRAIREGALAAASI